MVKHVEGVKLDKIIKRLSERVVKVGYFPNSVYEDGTPVAYIAATHEYGSVIKRIPPRPTLSPALEKEREQNIESIKRGFNSAVEGRMNIDDVLEQLALSSSGAVVREISSLTDPPLSPYTIEQRKKKHHAGKASNKPLVDSGIMIQSVNGIVEDK